MPYTFRNGFDPMNGPRVSRGWTLILRALEDGNSHIWSDIVDSVTADTDLQAKTVSNLLHNGVLAGYFARSGDYRNGTRSIVQIKWED